MPEEEIKPNCYTFDLDVVGKSWNLCQVLSPLEIFPFPVLVQAVDLVNHIYNNKNIYFEW